MGRVKPSWCCQSSISLADTWNFSMRASSSMWGMGGVAELLNVAASVGWRCSAVMGAMGGRIAFRVSGVVAFARWGGCLTVSSLTVLSNPRHTHLSYPQNSSTGGGFGAVHARVAMLVVGYRGWP